MTHARSKELSGFLPGLQELRTSPKGLSQALGLQATNLARSTGAHSNTLRNPSSKRLQGHMHDVVTVISDATDHTGDADKAVHWDRNELVAKYGHRTAAELIAVGRIEAALAFLRDLKTERAGEA